MNGTTGLNGFNAIWGKHPNYDDVARFEYGRRLWKHADFRHQLTAHWLDERHRYRQPSLQQREWIEAVLGSRETPEELQGRLSKLGTSLRCIAREIPLAFGNFFAYSNEN